MTDTMKRQLRLEAPMLHGDDVLAVQRRLAERGVAVAATGWFDAATVDAVKRFQAQANLVEDGIVGPVTWAALLHDAAAASDPLAPATIRRLTEWHRYYPDGCRWRVTPAGVAVDRDTVDRDTVEPATEAEQALVRSVLARFRQPLLAAIAAHPVPIENVLACICTESSGNPAPSVRLEPGCDRQDPSRTPNRCSHGLMQTLLSTAREVLEDPTLALDALARPEVSILAGTAYMARQARHTRHDPPLAAAAYNAGSLRHDASPANRWRLVQYPLGTSRHVDRFVRFVNAAMPLIDGAGLPQGVPNLRRLLRAGGGASSGDGA